MVYNGPVHVTDGIGMIAYLISNKTLRPLAVRYQIYRNVCTYNTVFINVQGYYHTAAVVYLSYHSFVCFKSHSLELLIDYRYHILNINRVLILFTWYIYNRRYFQHAHCI